MEKRLYFVLGDAAAVAGTGALAGLAATVLVGESWLMLPAMGIGMAVGMALALPASFLFMPLFGAMEVMLPVMLGGMLSGMWIAMAAAMRPLGLAEAALCGAGIGLAGLVACTAADAWLKRKGNAWTS
ncbi:MAG: hypothetical protein J4G09_07465 [Proteobacteria bacterium]|nr:hypothetical protein [Pseudomonadota bacterium]